MNSAENSIRSEHTLESTESAIQGCASEALPESVGNIADFNGNALLMRQESLKRQNSDTPPFTVKEWQQEDHSIKHLCNEIKTLVNFQEHLRLSMEVFHA